ncbi:conserved hypothetical protein [Frankia canadensis]|uniref:Uncharacterized protein n=1 Tax=Frankia canadensis TaxID=1836972 RepID=A0A2I2KQP1_9ACTN|nr:hypothetical protein [Frankia canadensis]SNQ47985.1 conserved hypothetical protein [Frankia canadensis]SOU55275.1 conserved hypothetical protein [Frankia canadensis]
MTCDVEAARNGRRWTDRARTALARPRGGRGTGPERRFGTDRRARVAGVAAAAMLATTALAGCNGGLLGTAKASGPLDCGKYEEKTPESGAPLLLVLLDVSDNSPATAQRVEARLQPYLDTALKDGSFIRLVASGGGPMTYSDCFHGDRMFEIKRNNSRRAEKDRTAAAKALGTEVSHIVQAEKVNPAGSVTGLLGGINDEVTSARSTPGVKVTDVTVLVWTDLLGTGQDADCLNTEGKTASPSIAEGLVKRCFETGQIASAGAAKVRFLGVNEGTADRPQQELARYLRAELCRRISSDCS